MLFDTQNRLSLQSIGDDRTREVLKAAGDRASGLVRPSDLLAAALSTGDARILATLAKVLDPGCSPADLLGVIAAYNPARTTPTDFDGRRERYSPDALAALDEFDARLREQTERSVDIGLELLLSCVLSHLDPEDREFLTPLDAARGAKLFADLVTLATESLTPLFDAGSRRLRSEEFTEAAWNSLEHAAAHAAELGYDRVLPPHCLLGMLGETEGITEQLIRLQAQPDIGPAKVAQVVAEAFRLADRKPNTIELTQDEVGEACVSLLKSAQKAARLWGAERIDTGHLLAALLADMPSRLVTVLQRGPLALDLAKMREHLDYHLREVRSQVKREIAFRLPSALLPSEDLTYRARTEGLPVACHVDRYFEAISKALYRRGSNHVLVTGLRGVGKTTLVWELARRAASGEIPFLRIKRFLWVDCRDVPPEKSREKLDGILTFVAGRTDLILCLDGLGPLLRAGSGADNKLLFRSILKDSSVQIIGVLSNWDFEELFSADQDLNEFFVRVPVEEPEPEAAFDMVKQASAKLADEFKLSIEPRAIERAVRLSAEYILSERLPAKANKILRRVCEDRNYEKTQQKETRTNVTPDDVIKVVSQISGVPEGTLAGVADKADYGKELQECVAGQDDAIAGVATELGLIKAGLTDPSKPASVLFFAGLTGTGKTELAKALARFYSASKHLQTYTMGNFTESHTVSGIIGVPPGYVGHDQGGRLINDLNSDPYCVFLLDEAEKAHPDVWKPFLNLFDEGWIVDQRGVKAFADRAIFILTSNAGHELIAEMSQKKKPMEAITQAVKDNLSKLRNERTGQPIFSPEFLARIKRIIVFKPLDEVAMERICRIQIKRMQGAWREKREKTVNVPDNLIKYIARKSYAENERSGGKEGGRIVAKLISSLIEAAIQEAATRDEAGYKTSNVVKLLFVEPTVEVQFITEPLPKPSACLARAMTELEQILAASPDGLPALHRAVSAALSRLEAGIKEWALRKANDADHADSLPEGVLAHFRDTCERLQRQAKIAEDDARRLVADLVRASAQADKQERASA